MIFPLLLLALAQSSRAAPVPKQSGFACANFRFAMELAPDGAFPVRLRYQPSEPGSDAEETARGSLSFREGEAEIEATAALAETPLRAWPFARARYASPRLPQIDIELEAFCPIVRAGDPYWSALPLGMVSVAVRNASDAERTVDLLWRFDLTGERRGVLTDEAEGMQLSGFDGDALSARSDAPTAGFSGTSSFRWTQRLRVAAKSRAVARICFARSPRTTQGTTDATVWPSSAQLAARGVRYFAAARAGTAAIDDWMPRTGDAWLDSALRAYGGASVMMTRVGTDGTVSLNDPAGPSERDAYWATFLHSVLFPDVERAMLDASWRAQKSDGSVPVTSEGVEGNAYAILRAFRDARWQVDPAFSSSIAANLKGAAAWILAQEARSHSPVIAALEDLATAMRAGRDNPQTLEAIESALVRLRREAGGGDALGILFGVVPADRAAPIWASLAPQRRKWGIAGAGRVLPWLNFADAWGRLRAGRPEEGIALLRDVSRADLVRGDVLLPHAALDGESGVPLGPAPEPAGGAFFGAIFHGLFGIERTREGMLVVAPPAFAGRGWRVRIPVVEGEVEISDGVGDAPPRVRWKLTEELPLRIRIPGRAPFETIAMPGSGERELR